MGNDSLGANGRWHLTCHHSLQRHTEANVPLQTQNRIPI